MKRAAQAFLWGLVAALAIVIAAVVTSAAGWAQQPGNLQERIDASSAERDRHVAAMSARAAGLSAELADALKQLREARAETARLKKLCGEPCSEEKRGRSSPADSAAPSNAGAKPGE